MKLPDLSINRNTIVNIIIVCVTLIIIFNIYQSQTKKIQTLEANRDAESQKNSLLNEINKLEKVANSYKKNFNKEDSLAFITTINNIAKNSGVKIISIKPSRQQDYSMYTKYSFDLDVRCDNYHEIGKFASLLESHPDIYTIERLSIGRTGGGFTSEQEDIFSISLTLSTNIIKN